MSKLIVWDLFGGGQNSVYKALGDNPYFDVYTFDVTEPTRDKHFVFDLAQDDICEKMEQFIMEHHIPRPDIIVSSTLCQSFSSVLSMKGGGTTFWKYNEDHTALVERSIEEFEQLKSGFTRLMKAETQLFIKRLGEQCINNTIALIDHFRPTCWYIENPKASLIWQYITLNKKDWYEQSPKYMNIATYGKYGFLIRKDTIFLSNIKLDLLTGKVEAPYTVELEECPENEYNPSRGKIKNGKFYKIWYVDKETGKKTWCPKDAGLGKLQKIDPKSQKVKMSNAQTCEAGSVSAIPSELLKSIFKQFAERSSH